MSYYCPEYVGQSGLIFVIYYSIGGYARRKAVAKDWYSNGEPQDTFKLNGKVEIIQQSEYDISDVEVMLKGLSDNSGYHVHLVSKRLVLIIVINSLHLRVLI